MTQELVLGVLLAGLVGLIWAMTVSILWTDRSPQTPQVLDAPQDEQRALDIANPTPKRRTIAA
jgi:hypothetical protein